MLPWCDREGISEPSRLARAAPNRLSTWLQTAPRDGGREGKRSLVTIETYLRTISYFVSWAKQQEEVAGNLRVQRPRLDRRLLDLLNRDEIGRLVRATNNGRDRLLVQLLAETGARAQEILDLRSEDLIVQGEQRFIRSSASGARNIS